MELKAISWSRCCSAAFVSLNQRAGKATGYGLDGGRTEVRFPIGETNFSLLRCLQTGPGTHPNSYPMDTVSCFPRE
jgi:hypothetical protein